MSNLAHGTGCFSAGWPPQRAGRSGSSIYIDYFRRDEPWERRKATSKETVQKESRAGPVAVRLS